MHLFIDRRTNRTHNNFAKIIPLKGQGQGQSELHHEIPGLAMFCLVMTEIWLKNESLQGSSPYKVTVIDKNKWHHGIPWPKNIDLDTKIVILSVLVQTLWSKRSFCIMVESVSCSCMSHIQTAQKCFLIY